jgi:microcystin-dependent protein
LHHFQKFILINMEFFIGTIMPFAGSRAPESWMFCSGQQLPISQYEALFSLIGTTYGGNGVTTFSLPNLCGRVAIHAGQAPQMQNYIPGQNGGEEIVTITVNNLPVHNHTGTIDGKPPCANTAGTTSAPAGNYPAMINGGAAQYNTSSGIFMGVTVKDTSSSLSPVGDKEPIEVLSPYCTLNYIICIEGIYPPRD